MSTGHNDIVITRYPPPSRCRYGCAREFAYMITDYLGEAVLYVEVPDGVTLNEWTETVTTFVCLAGPRNNRRGAELLSQAHPHVSLS